MKKLYSIARALSHHKTEKGQSLAMFGISIATLVSIVAMAVGVGVARPSASYTTALEQGVDTAALAAAAYFTRGYTISEMRTIAKDSLIASGIEVTASPSHPDTSVSINTCDSDPGNLTLCPTAGQEARKLVSVRVTNDIDGISAEQYLLWWPRPPQ